MTVRTDVHPTSDTLARQAAADLPKHGDTLDEFEVTRDGSLITASRPEDSDPFADAILDALKK